jgi:hypothetical protein
MSNIELARTILLGTNNSLIKGGIKSDERGKIFPIATGGLKPIVKYEEDADADADVDADVDTDELYTNKFESCGVSDCDLCGGVCALYELTKGKRH